MVGGIQARPLALYKHFLQRRTKSDRTRPGEQHGRKDGSAVEAPWNKSLNISQGAGARGAAEKVRITPKLGMVRDTAWNLQSTLGQSARNVTVPGLLCQPCAGESCIGPERGCVSVLFSIYGSEPQSGSKRSVHPPPGRALTHQAADSGGPGGATLQPPPSAFPSLPRTQESGDCPGVPQSSSEAPPPTHRDC